MYLKNSFYERCYSWLLWLGRKFWYPLVAALRFLCVVAYENIISCFYAFVLHTFFFLSTLSNWHFAFNRILFCSFSNPGIKIKLWVVQERFHAFSPSTKTLVTSGLQSFGTGLWGILYSTSDQALIDQAVSLNKNITWPLAFQKLEFYLHTSTMPNTGYLFDSPIVSFFLQPRLVSRVLYGRGILRSSQKLTFW